MILSFAVGALNAKELAWPLDSPPCSDSRCARNRSFSFRAPLANSWAREELSTSPTGRTALTEDVAELARDLTELLTGVSGCLHRANQHATGMRAGRRDDMPARCEPTRTTGNEQHHAIDRMCLVVGGAVVELNAVPGLGHEDHDRIVQHVAGAF